MSLEHHQIADRLEGLVLDGDEPAGLGVARLELGDFIHDVLPRPFGRRRVASLPVHPGQMQAEGGSFFVLVFGGDEAKGFVLVAGLEGRLFLGDKVFAVIDAPGAQEYVVTVLHLLIHVLNMNQPVPPPLASSGRGCLE